MNKRVADVVKDVITALLSDPSIGVATKNQLAKAQIDLKDIIRDLDRGEGEE